jgi:hypothetical protein
MLQTWENQALGSMIIWFLIVEVGNQDLALSLLIK